MSDSLDQIATDERFYAQLGRDGLMPPSRVLIFITDCEIRRRCLLTGVTYREEWRP